MWVTAFFSGVKVAIVRDLIGMRLRKVSPGPIVRAMITATKAGLTLELSKLEAHFLAGGNILKVIRALISADKARLGLTFEKAAAIDLAGRDVFEAVQISVNPTIPGQGYLMLFFAEKSRTNRDVRVDVVMRARVKHGRDPL